VIGGAGSLAVSPGGPLVIDMPQFPAAFKAEAASQAQVLDAMRADDSGADWFYVSPAPYFGPHNPGERTGAYRIGGDIVVADASGHSTIGGADFAIAVIDEVEKPAHVRARFTVAY
jgi:uncharacterized protein